MCVLSFLIYKQLFSSWNHSDWCFSLVVVFWVSVFLLLSLGLVLVFWVRGFLLRIFVRPLSCMNITIRAMSLLKCRHYYQRYVSIIIRATSALPSERCCHYHHGDVVIKLCEDSRLLSCCQSWNAENKVRLW